MERQPSAYTGTISKAKTSYQSFGWFPDSPLPGGVQNLVPKLKWLGNFKGGCNPSLVDCLVYWSLG